MEKQRTTKIVALSALFMAIIGMSVAFAAMSTQLQIDGSAEFRSPGWDVRFVVGSLNVTTSTYASTTTPTLTANNLGPFQAVLTRPGDSVTFTFDVTNAGGINARIDQILRNGVVGGMPDCVGLSTDGATAVADAAIVCGNLTYTLTYTDTGLPVAVNDYLDATTTRNLTLTLAYTGTTLPTDDVRIDGLGITINFLQR